VSAACSKNRSTEGKGSMQLIVVVVVVVVSSSAAVRNLIESSNFISKSKE
jgi:hypothetical protein